LRTTGSVCHQGLALAGPHLGDLPFVQDHAADELDVEVAHPESALGRLAHESEDVYEVLAQDLLDQRAAFLVLLGELREAGLDVFLDGGDPFTQSVIGERRDLRLPGVDLDHAREEALVLPLVLRPHEDFDNLVYDRRHSHLKLVRLRLGRSGDKADHRMSLQERSLPTHRQL